MNTSREWALLVAVVILVVGGVAYYFDSSERQSGFASPNRPAAFKSAPAAESSPSIISSQANSGSASPPPVPAGNPAIITEPVYIYNAQGQLALIHYPDGSVYSYRYNAQGDKISETGVKDGALRTWTYLYDENEHPIRIIDPNGRVVPTR